MSIQNQIRKGSTEILILRLLNEEPMYGYQIVQFFELIGTVRVEIRIAAGARQRGVASAVELEDGGDLLEAPILSAIVCILEHVCNCYRRCKWWY